MAQFSDYLLAGPFAGSSMIQSFLHPEDAYKAAEGEAEKGFQGSEESFGKGYEYLDPFRKQGLEQYSGLNEAGNQLMNPQELLSKWIQGYEQSPFAKQSLAENREQGLEAASSMGLMGSSGALGNIQKGASNIMQKDRREYLDDLMKKFLSGIGLKTELYGAGEKAASGMNETAIKQAMNRMLQGINMGQLKYGEQAAPGQLFENLLSTIANFAGGG